ncbi:Alpha-L RNA-binding motif [Venustampulla echinocandica]|uniref:Small ribosomal subunit protein uS4m n=1 Tax=Venustampulla echinocandica TaxID=2656787 RepID=A0A370TFV2_9HELO|nr:Alpha-L RNA-binding motif [Venustampulla echinocandica]RDL33774.1 Alpha-L RNA-binding motif [Venustampulla echinocandica]
MSRRRFHGLKRIKFRMTWNKYNLYNLTRVAPGLPFRTFFQQKWTAKSMTRAYHGEQIREGQWERMFNSRLNSVIPMDHKYLAEHDGSEHAAGRGSGLEKEFNPKRGSPNKKIPYMEMTYAPIERRLDVAIFRSLFASSARQARQFVTHGKVKVNGKKMPYPGYLLNPGDMFQVDPERVMYATGQPKTLEQIRQGRDIKRQRRITNIKRAEKKAAAREKALKAATEKIAAEEAGETPAFKSVREPAVPADEKEARKQRKTDLQALLKHVKVMGENKTVPLTAKRKQELRKFTKDVKTNMSQINRKPVEELQTDLTELVSRLSLIKNKQIPSSTTTTKPNSTPTKEPTQESAKPEPGQLTKQQFRSIMGQHRQDFVDESKPYATPWKPRAYMSAFAFIPRYLEVNHNICSAVYLRHPVARPGLAEVPTPFDAGTMQLAFNWYLRRR